MKTAVADNLLTKMSPLRGLGGELTDSMVDRFRWERFCDAPLDQAESSGRGDPPSAAKQEHFAPWDSAGNGAMSQPVRLDAVAASR